MQASSKGERKGRARRKINLAFWGQDNLQLVNSSIPQRETGLSERLVSMGLESIDRSS